MTFFILAGIALSGGCGGAASPAPNSARSSTGPVAAPAVKPWPVTPGQGEDVPIAAARDEYGSLWIWATADKQSLAVAAGNTTCAPGQPGTCQPLPAEVCAPEVQTEVCELPALDAEPGRCTPVTLRVGEGVSVPVSAPYAGVRMVPGLCLAATRRATPVPAGVMWWRFPASDHPRACDGGPCDMAVGGGSPAPDGTTWYSVPVGGPL